MAALFLNGLSIPISVQGADSSPNVSEDAARTVGGVMVRSRRAVVQSFKGNTIPVSATLAADINGIMNALMDHWSFDSATYWAWSEGGITTDGGTGAYATTTPSPKFGAGYLEVNAGAYWSAATALGTAWTVMIWTYESGAWHHYALTSTGIRYKDGAVYGSGIAFLSVVSGSTRIGDVASVAAQQFDDFLALQWVASAGLVAGVYALGVAVAAPSPYASGDLVADWAGIVTCEPPQVQYVPHMGSTFEQYGVTIQIQISQVTPS